LLWEPEANRTKSGKAGSGYRRSDPGSAPARDPATREVATLVGMPPSRPALQTSSIPFFQSALPIPHGKRAGLYSWTCGGHREPPRPSSSSCHGGAIFLSHPATAATLFGIPYLRLVSLMRPAAPQAWPRENVTASSNGAPRRFATMRAVVGAAWADERQRTSGPAPPTCRDPVAGPAPIFSSSRLLPVLLSSLAEARRERARLAGLDLQAQGAHPRDAIGRPAPPPSLAALSRSSRASRSRHPSCGLPLSRLSSRRPRVRRRQPQEPTHV